jgi:hypothetical protein
MLEPTFNAEAMATALGIPSGKHILRRHLAEEMSTVFHPAGRGLWRQGLKTCPCTVLVRKLWLREVECFC